MSTDNFGSAIVRTSESFPYLRIDVSPVDSGNQPSDKDSDRCVDGSLSQSVLDRIEAAGHSSLLLSTVYCETLGRTQIATLLKVWVPKIADCGIRKMSLVVHDDVWLQHYPVLVQLTTLIETPIVRVFSGREATEGAAVDGWLSD